MDERLHDILTGKEDNYVLPFYWMHEGNTGRIPADIAKIYESGCRALCVESRPYEHFCGEPWWRDLGIVIDEARRRDMKVWILDDKHYPTGFANGLMEKYPDRRRQYLREYHADVIGPALGMSFLVPVRPDETLLRVCAYRRSGRGEELTGSPVVFDTPPQGGRIYWDVPEGVWRMFYIFITPHGCQTGHEGFINGLSAKSVDVLLEAVYETHYQRFGQYFGNTIAGFFSDEPGMEARHIGPWGRDPGGYNRTTGIPGIALPWSDEVLDLMREKGADDGAACLPALWYGLDDAAPGIRLAYMDTVTGLWAKNFSERIGEWCRAHNVMYIGHIIEDMGAHARLGSAGHYFRALSGQDMSGIDIVLHQVMPGGSVLPTASKFSGGLTDPVFFHCMLSQLASSLADITPGMEGRAMCEVFGAYGWAEGAPTMKWLIDFLLVRGINHFVPHAFTDRYPDEDCPPHFYADGSDPQFDGFSALMAYTNRVSHLLSGAVRDTPAAILYHAENEWMNGLGTQRSESAAKLLLDSHIGYDILPLDALETAGAADGLFYVNGHRFGALVIPQARFYPPGLADIIGRLSGAGVGVYILSSDEKETGLLPGARRTAPGELAGQIFAGGKAADPGFDLPLLRMTRFRRGEADIYMFFNEHPTDTADVSVRLPSKGSFLRIDAFDTGHCRLDMTRTGKTRLSLLPGQSAILCFDKFTKAEKASFSREPVITNVTEPELVWQIALMEAGVDRDFIPYKETTELTDITAPGERPGLSGYMRYTTRLELDGDKKYILDLGRVGLTARLRLNGVDMGIRVSAPYSWDISGCIRDGGNDIEIIAANTLSQRVYDDFSVLLPLPPSGVLGPVRLIAL